jgi:hypothetical protein
LRRRERLEKRLRELEPARCGLPPLVFARPVFDADVVEDLEGGPKNEVEPAEQEPSSRPRLPPLLPS